MLNYKELGFAEEKFYEFPNIINLEVYRGACPCSCVHCPVGRVDTKDRQDRFGVKEISMDVLKKVITEMKAYPHATIRLHSVGEPILWSNIIPALKYVFDSNVRSWIFTSLVTNDTEILNALCDYCNIIEVSVNSINAEDYTNSKGIDAFEIVKNNIMYMAEYISKNNLNTRLVVSRVQSESEEEDKKFVDFWKETNLVADAFIRKYHNYNNLLEEKGTKCNNKVPCLVHWMRCSIAYDGTIVTCFNELFHPELRKDVVLGNIQEDSIYNIWHGEYFNMIRKAELNGYQNSQFAPDFPCRNCFSCQSYDGKRETSEHQVEALKERR